MTGKRVLLGSLVFAVIAYGTLARAASESVLHSFGSAGDGAYPFAGLTFDANGNLYGTASAGGGNNQCDEMGCGVVYRLMPAGRGNWNYVVLHSFTANEGGNPYSTVAIDHSGALYGTTLYYALGCGTVFSLRSGSGGTWSESTVHRFTCGDDGFSSYGVVFDGIGRLYGTAYAGGADEHGLIFYLAHQSALSWNELVLHAFDGSDGGAPAGNLIFDAHDNIYGTTYEGAPGLTGLVFELSPAGGAGWSESVLYAFQGTGFTAGPDGVNPVAGVVFDSEGNLYGTCDYGGPANLGAVFELSPNGDGTWTETLLHTFSGGSDGGHPYAGVILDQQGNVYGTTQGSAGNNGTVYKLSRGSNGQWTETQLYAFQGGADGSNPYGALVMDSAGDLYGTTAFGGEYGGGVIFEIPAQ